jgi:hypothetical protein
MMELIHAKMERGENQVGDGVYQITFVFGSPFVNASGKHVGAAVPVHMSFMNGMPPEDFVVGLRQLADHIEENHSSSTISRKLRVVGVDKPEG